MDSFTSAARDLEHQLLLLIAARAISPIPLAEGPWTLAELKVATREARAITGNPRAIPVWSGASDRTVWSSPNVNLCARAWHDSVHLKLGAELNFAGEVRVALVQLRAITGAGARLLQWIDTYGQLAHHARHGAFPVDQRAFCRSAFRNGIRCAVALGPW